MTIEYPVRPIDPNIMFKFRELIDMVNQLSGSPLTELKETSHTVTIPALSVNGKQGSITFNSFGIVTDFKSPT